MVKIVLVSNALIELIPCLACTSYDLDFPLQQLHILIQLLTDNPLIIHERNHLGSLSINLSICAHHSLFDLIYLSLQLLVSFQVILVEFGLITLENLDSSQQVFLLVLLL